MVRFQCYVGNLQLHCANVNHSILILIETLTHLSFVCVMAPFSFHCGKYLYRSPLATNINPIEGRIVAESVTSSICIHARLFSHQGRINTPSLLHNNDFADI